MHKAGNVFLKEELLYVFEYSVEHALNELRSYWNDLLSKYTLQSHDDKLNRMVDIWNPYQCMVTFNMSRSASYFESGIGRGMGFRNSNQDLKGFVHQIPEPARERIIDIASTQFENGGAYHQYQPLTKKGNHEVGGGKDAIREGAAKNSWLTGTAAWNFIAITQSILGIQPEWDGLLIDPCIPKSWDEFTITRVFRGDTYVIHITNPQHVSKGVATVTVDGTVLTNNISASCRGWNYSPGKSVAGLTSSYPSKKLASTSPHSIL